MTSPQGWAQRSMNQWISECRFSSQMMSHWQKEVYAQKTITATRTAASEARPGLKKSSCASTAAAGGPALAGAAVCTADSVAPTAAECAPMTSSTSAHEMAAMNCPEPTTMP